MTKIGSLRLLDSWVGPSWRCNFLVAGHDDDSSEPVHFRILLTRLNFLRFKDFLLKLLMFSKSVYSLVRESAP